MTRLEEAEALLRRVYDEFSSGRIPPVETVPDEIAFGPGPSKETIPQCVDTDACDRRQQVNPEESDT